MAELVCRECGEANDFDAEFCAYCHAFLAWDEPQRAGSAPVATGGRPPVAGEQVIETQVMPRVQVAAGAARRRPAPRAAPARPPAGGGGGAAGARGGAAFFQASAEQHEVTVP